METRMAKYTEEETHVPTSRVKRHASLYEEINNTEIEDFTLKSNATVIGRQEENIDIEKIKKILDTKYNEVPRRRSIRLEQEKNEQEDTASPTKEYDLNVILDKAKEEKEETYEEVRAKKLRDTQFDILKNLNISDQMEKNEEPRREVQEKPEDNDLLNLINTITLNEEKEKKHQEMLEEQPKESEEKEEAVDLLELQEEALQKEEKKDQTVTNSIEEIKNEIKKIEDTSSVINKNNLDNSFYTKSNLFKQKDFSNEDEEDDKLSVGVKILIVITLIGIAVGMYFFIKSIIGI